MQYYVFRDNNGRMLTCLEKKTDKDELLECIWVEDGFEEYWIRGHQYECPQVNEYELEEPIGDITHFFVDRARDEEIVIVKLSGGKSNEDS